MRTALALALFAIGCHRAAPSTPRAAAVDAGADAAAVAEPPKDPLPDAVERVVQLYEAIAALPPAPACDAAAIGALRAGAAAELATVQRARRERPAQLEELWTAQQARLAAAWPGLQRVCPDGIDPMEEP